jgi:serine/threonine protein kinase
MATREDVRLVAAPEAEPAEAAGDYPVGHFIPGPNVVVQKVLGRGGHATVYEAEISVLGKRVALKVLHPHLAQDVDMAKRMVAEARTLAKLEHPNIVQVFNAGFTTDERARAFILMELLQGVSGRQVLETKKRLPLANALEVVIDLASGLEIAHRNGVIHLDLKPDNIFVHTASTRAVAKLYDFGIQKIYDPKSLTGQTQSFEGTPPYAAPEQLRGETVTPRTDLYAFGVLLFEFVAGRRPFHEDEERDEDEATGRRQRSIGENPAHGSWLIDAQLHKRAPLLSSVLLVPAALEQLVAKCLEKDPARRPDGVAQLGAELRMILERLDSTFLSKSPTTTQDLLLSAARDANHGAKPPPAKAPVPPPEEPDWRGGTVRMYAPSTPEPAIVTPTPLREPPPATTPERRARFGSPGDAVPVATPLPHRASEPARSLVVPETLEGMLARTPEASPARPSGRALLVTAAVVLLLAPLVALIALRGIRHSATEPNPALAASAMASTGEDPGGRTTAAVVPLPPPVTAMAPDASTQIETGSSVVPSVRPPAAEAPAAVASVHPSKAPSKHKPTPAPVDDGPNQLQDPSLHTTFDVDGPAPAKTAAPKPTPKPKQTTPALEGF